MNRETETSRWLGETRKAVIEKRGPFEASDRTHPSRSFPLRATLIFVGSFDPNQIFMPQFTIGQFIFPREQCRVKGGGKRTVANRGLMYESGYAYEGDCKRGVNSEEKTNGVRKSEGQAEKLIQPRSQGVCVSLIHEARPNPRGFYLLLALSASTSS